MRTRTRSRLGSLFIGRDLAVVDPLFVHPFPAEPLFPGERVDRVRGCPGIAGGRRQVLSGAVRRAEDYDRQSEDRATQFHSCCAATRNQLIAHNMTTPSP